MERYSVITKKNQREIVLLKGFPCVWSKCTFCDYIEDNGTSEETMVALNKEVLSKVTGEYGVLEVINSGSIFELPKKTLKMIKDIVLEKEIKLLFFESHYSYRDRLSQMEDFFGIPIIFKCGIETFDDYFRNKVMRKGVVFNSIEEVASYFKSICILVGIKGQTKEMIEKDIDILTKYFEKGCVNVYVENSTKLKPDPELIKWFHENYSYLDDNENIEVLWNNTDFGVGGEEIET